ncbi:MAG: DNA primase [Rudaea sp.]|uniref:DNA primase n=1 Tax=unclassified Rudaea TaxID=2627037 RepID=UPI0010F4FD62|nr:MULTISPECIES: DNA primase [unclassified Rudaea]MBN8887028.1 DNA primase [Rudaea sp.]MBR0347774.1 DNA primase [Rudaea sp.]
MSGRIPAQFIDELLARVDIVDLIEQRVPLRKAGRDWTARCPFHDERSPSFTVSPAKQFYHCFGCGAHGSAIGFLMNYDRMEFPDAVEELASRVGLKVPYEGGGKRPVEDSTDLYTVLDAAAKFYQRELGKSAKARAYFDSRGLDTATVERFGLGYAPDQWDALKTALGTSKQRMDLLEKSGLVKSGERGKYEYFRNRVMFPIADRRGRTIAFGGRILEKTEDSGPKYLNSPETALFHKGQQLFALWQVRQAHAKIPRLIVVEGYMDVIALFQNGVTQAVATLGTATTRDHAELLFRNCADVYFCFDGDRAGRGAAWKAVESVLPRMRDGRQAFFLFLPEGEDPDSLVRSEGQSGFEERLKTATPLSEFFFANLSGDVNLASLDGKARLAERARPLLTQIPDGAFRDLMLAELDRRANVTLRIEAPPADAPRKPARPQERSLVRTVVALLLQNPGFAAAIEPPHTFSALRLPGVVLLVELIALCRERPEISTAAIVELYAEREEGRALQKLAVMEFPGGEDAWRAEFFDALRQLDRQTQIQRRDDLDARIRADGLASLSPEEKDELRRLKLAIATPINRESGSA